MERCYEYFDCHQTQCIVFQNKNEQACWETGGTLCFFQPLTPLVEESSQKDKCNYCLYKMHILSNK